ncbi:hypothetical protein ACFVAJ_19225 [Agromyces sp. NPDC057679]|uniref:hypothetical protein n=1 Tax=Agromyces sp. NPDC057679 TaxID=3346207 RepID=UPI00366F4262
MEEQTSPDAGEVVAEYESRMWDAAAEVAAARRLLDEADRRLQLARDAVAPAIRRYGAALGLDDRKVDREVIRALYWDHPDIRAKDISDAFAIHGGPGAVHLLTGASEAQVPCVDGCGTMMRITNRSSWSQARLCGPCKAARTDRAQQRYEEGYARHEANRAREEAEDRAWVREQLEAGLTPQQMLKSWQPEVTSSLARAIFAERMIAELSADPS